MIGERVRIANAILAYLVKHPGARDTADGISWWLLEQLVEEVIDQQMQQTSPEVQGALDELVARGLLEEVNRPVGKQPRLASAVLYQVNQNRMGEINEILVETA